MLEFFRPRFEGELELSMVPPDFPTRIAHRVEEGLLRKGSRRRANYRVLERGEHRIRFRADDRSTAINLV